MQYAVEGQSKFGITPWQGPPWNGFVSNCGYYFNGGSAGPFRCDGKNSGFQGKSFRLHSGACDAIGFNNERQLLVGGGCNRPSFEWLGFECRD
jgi:hypothetical protein